MVEGKLDNVGKIIQGGMGAGVSGYTLANAVSSEDDAMGVVSGTALDVIMARRLQQGNTEVRDALLEYPDKEFAQKVIDRYFVDGGKTEEGFKAKQFPAFIADENRDIRLSNPNLEKLIAAANFVEVRLAKKGHNNPVGINYLHKIQWPLMPSIYGAMLAGVDHILIGAGFPTEVPAVLESLAEGEVSRMRVPLFTGEKDYHLLFDPKGVLDTSTRLEVPGFIGIVGNHLGVKGLKDVDGYIFEGPPAGGHNAPAREKGLTDAGEPRYGPKDDINYKLLEGLLSKNAEGRGVVQPFWLAGSYANRLGEAIELGARGIQVGTIAAFSRESGLYGQLRRHALQEIMKGAQVFTDPRASPSGFPFKILRADGTLAIPELYEGRERICNLGYLIDLGLRGDGSVFTRCPAEPIVDYIKKGGEQDDTLGRMCLCNSLMADIGIGSVYKGVPERPLVTSGVYLGDVKAMVDSHGLDYSVKDALNYIKRQ